ncbi:putative G-X-X-X-Q-X-W domain-containing protein [Lyophyllum shimeji]|uniref:G-X-X-X-Q-X-W domain-containing protein n=1 Tax=Lyophyllum shimeji TaxID=47721 RepID=A0A9P3PK36_LYOSH|nr:putative G-X-X-X-Q-X-W domain-containing protein [Lyophyllum shimeji]
MRTFSLPGHFLTLAVAATLASAVREITLVNSCPAPINIFVNGNWVDYLPDNGGTSLMSFNNNFTGFIYTDVNGGSETGVGTTRAGFFGQNGYYYIVLDPNHLNVGMDITPTRGPYNGFCEPATCNSLGCPTAYTFPPTRFPPPSFQAPNPPLYACPRPTNVGFTITFCPTGVFPPITQGLEIHPNGDMQKCLDVSGGVYADGTPVQIYDCNGTGAQKWIFRNGRTSVQVAGTNFCLDAGSSPGNGIGMKIWTCYRGLAAQEWIYFNNKFRLARSTQCLDLTDGNLSNGNPVQTWHCSAGNPNQRSWNNVQRANISRAFASSKRDFAAAVSFPWNAISPSPPSACAWMRN